MKRPLTTGHRPLQGRNWLWSWGVLFIYSVLVLILTYPLLFNLTAAVPIDIGDPLLNTWILAWDAHALFTDPLNLFNANIFYPLPNTLAFSEHLFSTALLALPLQMVFGEPVLAYNLSLLLTFPLAAFGMYLLALRWTHHCWAAFIAGLIFAFSPYRLASIAHLQLLTFQWLPYLVLCLDLLLERGSVNHTQGRASKPALLIALAIFFLLQVLASWYLAIYTILILGIYILIALVTRRVHLSQLIPVIAILLFVTLLILPFIFPYLTLVDQLRASRPLSLALSLSAAPTDYLAAISFNRIFGPLTELFRSRPGFIQENALFLGVVIGLMVLVGLVAGGRRIPRHVFYALLTILILSILLTLPIPYALLATLFPPATIVRVPPRWIIPGLFALSGLAAFGVAILTRNASRAAKYAILTIICILLIIESLSIPLPLALVENKQTLNPVYHWVAAQPGHVALVELPMHSAPAPEYPEVKRMVASTLGWWSMVNGYSGYTPPRQPELAQALTNFPNDKSIETLQKISTAPDSSFFILIHPGEAPLDRTQWETTDRWFAQRNPALYPIGEFEGDYLYQVLPESSPKISTPLATFGPNQNIRLLAANIELPNLGDTSLAPRLLFYWQADTPPVADATIFIHLRAADGFVRSQADGPPVSGHYPTSQWQPGEIIQDVHPLPLVDFSQIDHIAIGFYNPATGERLPALGPDGRQLVNNAVVIQVWK